MTRTSGQRNLDFKSADMAAIAESRPLSREEQFQKFHSENPGVYEFIRDRALRLKRHGYSKWSIEEIWNNLRWVRQCKTTGKPYALDNNFKAFYVALLLDREPSLEGFFDVRKRRRK